MINVHAFDHHISGESSPGWGFPWSFWSKQKLKQQPVQAKPKPIKKQLARTSKQSFQEKEIIDVGETVCLPRYQCGRAAGTTTTRSFNVPFTDLLNEQSVRKKSS